MLLVGLKFFSKDGSVVLQTDDGLVADDEQTHTVHLNDGERIIGYQSRSLCQNLHYDLIFGRLVWIKLIISLF